MLVCSQLGRASDLSGGVITGGARGIYDPEVPEELRVRDGLPNVFKKLQDGETVHIGYVGGSITEANGWRPKSFAWFKEQYPNADLVEINAAIPGTGADFAASRIATDLLPYNPDLVMIEYRVNGARGFDARAVEGLVRQIWEHNTETDICFFYTIAEWMLKDMQAGKQYHFGKTMEQIANHYGIPSVDLGVEVVKQMNSGDLIFKDDGPVEGKLVFSQDGVHPGDAGHGLYNEIARRSLDTIRAQKSESRKDLPAPLNTNHFGSAKLMPISEAEQSKGWTKVDIEADDIYRRDTRRTHNMLRGGLKSDRVGETLTIHWVGRTIGLTHIPQGDGMEIEVSIDGNASEVVKFKQSSDKYLYAQFHYLPEQPQGEHTATIRIRNLPNGSAFYFGQVIVVSDPE
ncbi:SGNH/GDSL hydrolase family protein [Rubellicoccus peritrichatus]|uniref:SGNH/GDSL hydrolase family protein n=1 Tax=Rubellicoccus peritrichatus TaxID=3080537 RepID=A0AAQ3L5Q6_9BACT|nr:SGNH/GDSL hydrolase family protein [Puniceicoccus sp. CR14]WOO39929.1 SGNH/GDSL hydrolase family protein [Puniceicoccus sp. CR14]